MLRKIAETIKNTVPATEVAAHCDGPCGVYDPSSARIAAEAAVSMTKKILAMEVPAAGDAGAWAAYNNTMSRYVAIKEEQAHLAKEELLILWTDYFKPPHLEKYPNHFRGHGKNKLKSKGKVPSDILDAYCKKKKMPLDCKRWYELARCVIAIGEKK